MNGKSRQLMLAFAVCVAALLTGGRALIAAAQDVPDEAALIQVLKSDAGWAEKQTACRSLRVNGTAASVPALAALLPDKELSHMARYALEAMPYLEAGQALRDALAKTAGMPKTGVIISLGARRDTEAVPQLMPLLKDPDADIARAAIGALGRIATPPAQEALMQFCGEAPEPLRLAVAEALLAVGQRLPQEVKPETGNPVPPLYSELLSPRWPMLVRMGAFRGWAYADPKRTAGIVHVHLIGDEPVFRNMAAQIIAETSGEETTKFYGEMLAKLFSVDARIALLRGLAGRKDPVARPAVVQCVQTAEKPVNLAAIKTLAVLGNAQDVPVLVALLAADDGDVAAAANAALATLQAPEVNAALADAAPKAAPAVRAKLLDLLADRRAGQTVDVAAKGLADADSAVRVAALRALALLAGKDHVAGILRLLVKTDDPAERAAAEKTLVAAAAHVGEDALAPVLDAINGAAPDARIALLHVLARIGGPKALEPVLTALSDANAQIGDEAVRVLSDWPTADAVPHVLKLAQSDDLSPQVLGLRGYVRLAGIEPSADEKTRMLATAMTLAKRPDEKKLVLGAWGAAPTQESLDALRPHLDDAAVQNEAAIALITIAPELAKNPDAKPKVIDALKAVVEKAADTTVRNRAQKALAPLQ